MWGIDSGTPTDVVWGPIHECVDPGYNGATFRMSYSLSIKFHVASQYLNQTGKCIA